MLQNIILTTGVYDLIKDHVRRKKVTQKEEELLVNELKKASQVRRRNLPPDIVSVNRKVTFREHTANIERTVVFTGPEKSRPGKNKLSILSDEGIAMVGYGIGSLIEWPSKKGLLKFEIVKVEEAA